MIKVTKQAKQFRKAHQDVAKAVVALEKKWTAMVKEAYLMMEDDFDTLPTETQVRLRKPFLKSPFNFGIEMMVSNAVISGGLETLVFGKDEMRETFESQTELAQKAEAKARKEAKDKEKAEAKAAKELEEREAEAAKERKAQAMKDQEEADAKAEAEKPATKKDLEEAILKSSKKKKK